MFLKLAMGHARKMRLEPAIQPLIRFIVAHNEMLNPAHANTARIKCSPANNPAMDSTTDINT